MAREIKFRALIIKGVSNEGQWRYWNLFEEPSDLSIIDKDTKGEYTGLKDKNGKEIYEGDIIRIERLGDYTNSMKTFIVKVEWLFNGWYYLVNGLDFPLIEGCETLEVIGNIYENPEILK